MNYDINPAHAMRVHSHGYTDLSGAAASVHTHDLDDLASGAADTWTPTVGGTGWSKGNGTTYGYWWPHGPKLAVVKFGFVFGSTTGFGSGALELSLPFDPADFDDTFPYHGQGGYEDVGTQVHPGVFGISGTTAVCYVHGASGTYATLAGITSTVPVTAVAGDKVWYTAILVRP